MQNVIRRCPSCQSEREATELFCENEVNGSNCGWPLSDQELIDINSPSCESADTVPDKDLLVNQSAVNTVEPTLCVNGHSMSAGDILCLECGALTSQVPTEPSFDASIEGWRLIRELPKRLEHIDYFLAEKAPLHDGKRYVAHIFDERTEPDQAIYTQIERLGPNLVTPVIDHGKSSNRFFEVWEECSDRSIEELNASNDLEQINIRNLVEKFGSILKEFTDSGLRHRDLRPRSILLSDDSSKPYRLRGFDTTTLVQMDLADTGSPVASSRYTAPELICGGITSSSDWWSFGMILLEMATKGNIFSGVNEKAFLIHVVTRGIDIPDDVDSELSTLLAGLLTLDANKRWQWPDVQRWLKGEIAAKSFTKNESQQQQQQQGSSISFGGREFVSPESFALSAAESQNWEEAKQLLLRGAVTTWLIEHQAKEATTATVKSICHDPTLPDDIKLAFVLLALNRGLPLSIRGEIVSPAWLLSNAELGYQLITGSRIERLKQLGREPLLVSLSERVSSVRKRIEVLDINIDETRLRESLLATSRKNLESMWARFRCMFPDSRHSGIEGLLQKRNPTEEDYIILLSSPVEEFSPAAEVLTHADDLAKKNKLGDFSRSRAEEFLSLPRNQIYEVLDENLEGFAHCGIEVLDQWADTYRMEKRIRLERALLLLNIPKAKWTKPAHQEYISNILGFFEKKILAKVNRGPLVKQTIGRTSSSIDLTEVSSSRRSAQQILDHLLERSTGSVEIDPEILSENLLLGTRLSSLIKKTRIFSRDTGRHGLFLGFPYLVYRTTNVDETVSYRSAPLILWPIKIEADTSGRGKIKIASELQREEVRLNPAIEGIINFDVLKIEQLRRCADEIAHRSSLRYKDVLSTFAQVIEVPNREILRLPDKTSVDEDKIRYVSGSAVLFNCDFSGKSIADDLRYMKERPLEGSALERVLKISTSPEKSATISPGAVLNDKASHRAIMNLDPSQTQAVSKANEQSGLHIEGPPGTGKSQTIVNMIADAIAQGETVLVVCQKQAALNIVEKRLKAHGLENRLFLINDIQKDREPIIKSFRLQRENKLRLPGGLGYYRNEQSKLISKLEQLDSSINGHHEAFHSVHNNIGLSYREILSQLMAIESQNNYVSVPNLRKLLAEKGISDADAHRIADGCSGIAKLWLDSNFEQSPLHCLQKFSWEQETELSITNGITNYLKFEQVRSEAVSTYSLSPDVGEIEVIQNWLTKSGVELSAISDTVWDCAKVWLPFFTSASREPEGQTLLQKLSDLAEKISVINKSSHLEPLSNVLVENTKEDIIAWLAAADVANNSDNSSSRKSSRWNICRYLSSKNAFLMEGNSNTEAQGKFDVYLSLEKERERTLNETAQSFDTTDGLALTAWLKDHHTFFSKLRAVDRINLKRWFQSFASDGGKQIIAALENNLAALNQLPDNNCDDLFELLSTLSPDSLSDYHSSAKIANQESNPFNSEKDEQLRSRWLIVKLLKASGISDLKQPSIASMPELKAALEKFIESEQQRLKWIRENKDAFIVADGTSLGNWIESHTSIFEEMPDDTRVRLANWLRVAGPGATDLPFIDKLSEELNELKSALHKLKTEHHNERLFGHLISLPPARLIEWISISQKAATGHALNPSTHVARWKLKKLLISLGCVADRSSILQFVDASRLEYELSPLRFALKAVLKKFELPVSDATAVTVDELAHKVDSLSDLLSRLRIALTAILNCPAASQARQFALVGTKSAFTAFAENAKSAIELSRIRKQSLLTLKNLKPWFNEGWIAEFDEHINSLHHDMNELKLIWDGLALFNNGTMRLFEQSINFEKALRPIRLNAKQTSEQLNALLTFEKLGQTELIQWTTHLVFDTRTVSDCVLKLQACPCETKNIRFIDDISLESLDDFWSQGDNAVRRWRSKLASQGALESLYDLFEDSWVSNEANCIARNACHIEQLEAVAPILNLLNDSTFERFRRAVKLELDLKELRPRFDEVAKTLSVAEIGNNASVFELEKQTSSTVESLEAVSQVAKKIDACPARDAAIKFIRRGGRLGYQELTKYLVGIVVRSSARKDSEESLLVLADWFSKDWVNEQRSRIVDNKFNLEELQSIESSLPSLQAFQLFRQRAQLLDKDCLAVLDACQKYRKVFHTKGYDNLQNVFKATIGRECCLHWKAVVENENPEISLEGDEIEQKITDLVKHNEGLTALNKQILTAPDWSKDISLDDNEWNSITRLRGQRMIRLREFVDKGSELGLLKIRPIWLMNPEVVSRLLPLQKGFFDKVIFDEASQLPVEYALPALYRAKRAVVSGDGKQMPPSDFFSSRIADDDDSDDSGMDDDFLTESQRAALDEKWNRREIKDCPDLLTLASDVLPSTKLEIHYRSEYRELIAFSNAAFYGGTLNVPSKHPPDEVKRAKPIEVVRANSTYQKQTNRGEAEKVVDELRKLWKLNPRPSVGVVTFNLPQSELIEDLLGEEAERDSWFARIRANEDLREEDGEDMSFFVKNLENVQGDERDVIIFSTTFGRNEKGVFARFFGKISQAGGDRRLNVAVTRAKQKVILVTSMIVDEISDCIQKNRKPATGREYLHYYLEYAARVSNGNLEQANALLAKLNPRVENSYVKEAIDGFISDVQAYVETLGYQVTVGSTENSAFDLDIAVINPITGLFAFGIECDAPRHHLLKGAFHREVWRQDVLHRSIKTVHRISSRHWYQNKTQQQKVLKQAILESMV